MVSDYGESTQRKYAEPGDDVGHTIVLIMDGFTRLIPREYGGKAKKPCDEH